MTSYEFEGVSHNDPVSSNRKSAEKPLPSFNFTTCNSGQCCGRDSVVSSRHYYHIFPERIYIELERDLHSQFLALC
jgi:hypothetical protein